MREVRAMSYADAWLAEMWMPVHQQGWVSLTAADPRRHFEAEKRLAQRAAAKRARDRAATKYRES
jgi:hypothetical protein